MSEDTNRRSRPNQSVQSDRVQKPVEKWTKESWESLTSDPSNSDDLGYELEDWEQFEALDYSDQLIFLPNDKSQIEDAAFLVVEENTILDLENHC